MVKKLFTVSMFILAASLSLAEDPKFVEGVHYKVIDNPVNTSYRGEEIGEIMEFFSFSCIHCFNFEPAVKRFQGEKPDNIRFTAVPVMFRESQAPEVRAYYVIKFKKLGDEAMDAVFNQIHVKRKALRTDGDFAAFFTQFGLSKEDYMKEAYSFAVASRVSAAVSATGNSEIAGTPGILANGKYLIDSGAVGGNEMALYAAKWLIENDAKNQ